MKNRDLILLAVLAWLFWPKREVAFELKKDCTYPDGTVIQVPLSADCPYDDAHGGQSVRF